MTDKDKQELFRKIPAVDRLLEDPGIIEISSKYPRSLILEAIHQVLDEIRKSVAKGEEFKDPSKLTTELVTDKVVERIGLLAQPSSQTIELPVRQRSKLAASRPSDLASDSRAHPDLGSD